MEIPRMAKRRKKPFYKRKSFLYPVLFFVLVILAGAGYYTYSFYDFLQNTSKPDHSVPTAEEWTGTERVNIVLIGVDARPGEGAPRSDTMMVLSIDPQTKQASLFSVLRDTYYKIPGYGFRKINEAHALGGPRLVKETLSKFLQIPIHYYVKTDFQGFADIVDVLGGIDMYVEKDMVHYDDGIYNINLKKGQQHLDGKHALMYVRYRGDAGSDYSRTERQRKFLATLASEMKTTSSLLKLPEILKAVQGDIQTDMSFNDMLKLGRLAYNLDLNKLDSVQLPPLHDSTGTKLALFETSRDGASVVIPDVYETRLLVHKTLNTGKLIVRTTDDQEPMVHQVAVPKPDTATVPPSSKAANGKDPAEGKGGGDTQAGGKTKPGDVNAGRTSGNSSNTGGSNSQNPNVSNGSGSGASGSGSPGDGKPGGSSGGTGGIPGSGTGGTDPGGTDTGTGGSGGDKTAPPSENVTPRATS